VISGSGGMRLAAQSGSSQVDDADRPCCSRFHIRSTCWWHGWL